MIDNGFKLEVRIKKTVEIFYKDEEVWNDKNWIKNRSNNKA
jgi:hypothetical protein